MSNETTNQNPTDADLLAALNAGIQAGVWEVFDPSTSTVDDLADEAPAMTPAHTLTTYPVHDGDTVTARCSCGHEWGVQSAAAAPYAHAYHVAHSEAQTMGYAALVRTVRQYSPEVERGTDGACDGYGDALYQRERSEFVYTSGDVVEQIAATEPCDRAAAIKRDAARGNLLARALADVRR